MASIRLMKPISLERGEGKTWEQTLAALPLRFPLLASPKLDGIRAATPQSRPQSNSGKPFPNPRVMELLRRPEYANLDGELIAGSPAAPGVCHLTQSVVMSEDADVSNLSFYVFDSFRDGPFGNRYPVSSDLPLDYSFARALSQTELRSVEDILTYMNHTLSLGYEGVILRDPAGAYKHGRSTLGCDRQGRPKPHEWGMLRIKPREDMEAVIVGWEPLRVNTNEAYASELGYAKRSSAKFGKVEIETIGSLRLKSKRFPKEYGLGIADPKDQAYLWSIRDKLEGLIAKHTYFPYGSIEAPRQPQSYLGIRHPIDLDDEV